MENQFSLKDKLGYGLFWSWNMIFLAFMVLGFAPRLLPEVLEAVRTRLIPSTFLIYGLILSLVPVAAIILGLTVLKRQPRRLFALGYVVEGPLMLILAMRFFLIRQATPGIVFVLLVAFLGMGAFLWYLLDTEIEKRGRWVAFVRLFGLSLMVLTSLYAAIWIAFYAVPLAGVVFDWLRDTLLAPVEFMREAFEFIKDVFREGLIWVPFAVLGFILVLYTGTLFLVAPVAVPVLSIRAWWGELRALGRRAGDLQPAVVSGLAVILTVLFFLISNQQPQKAVFTLLDKQPGSIDEAIELLEKEEVIRSGLLNVYLAPFRYMSSQGEVRHVRVIYEDVFGLSSVQAYRIQQAYESVARPLLYEPVFAAEYPILRDNVAFQREPAEAARRYQAFFDTPIIEGERELIVNAVRTTWSADQATAAWQAVDNREIHLTRQEISITEHGDWADVELYEVYQNQTRENQELIYYFNLPESAVITGVWLGESSDRAERDAYQVAPRGAAQQVYREEVRRNVDPALLEQIGPRQYRLRIFPVLALAMRWDEEQNRTVAAEAPDMHMWLTYRTFADGDGWPMPRLAEWDNLYWDESSERSIPGMELSKNFGEWLPDHVPSSQVVEPMAHRMDFPGGESVLILPAEPRELADLPSGLRYAVVLDRSYSMAIRSEDVSLSLAELEQLRAGEAEVDVYLTASSYRGEAPKMVSLVDAQLEEIIYFGGQKSGALLAQYAKLNEGREYDAVLVLTDDSGYELGGTQVDIPVPDAPVWLVHLGGGMPLGYDDKTLEAIQASGGGVAGDLNEALTRLAVSLEGRRDTVDVHQDVLDGYTWTVLPTDKADEASPADTNIEIHQDDGGFGALAARRLILAEMTRNRGTIDQLETLDYLHALAVEHSVITPYSSMIVLVRRVQRDKLENLASQADRFEREYEDLGETTPEPQAPLRGVPEPHEWLLIGLAVAMLVWYASRKRGALSTMFINSDY
jgi:putative PEP-CTERM system integral membrane protein